MFDLVTSFLSGLDKEAAIVLGTGFGAMVISIGTAVLGIKRGKPGTISDVAAEISKISCGAPVLQDGLHQIGEKIGTVIMQNQDALDAQRSMRNELTDMRVELGILRGRMDR